MRKELYVVGCLLGVIFLIIGCSQTPIAEKKLVRQPVHETRSIDLSEATQPTKIADATQNEAVIESKKKPKSKGQK